MITQSITCDTCSKELITDTPYPHNFNFELRVIDTNRNTSGIQFAVHMSPPFDGVKHFCSKKCLGEFCSK
jgi:hypothetical protein